MGGGSTRKQIKLPPTSYSRLLSLAYTGKAVQRCSVKKLSSKISENSQKNNCNGIDLQ